MPSIIRRCCSFVVVGIAIMLGLVAHACSPLVVPEPLPEALEALRADSVVVVQSNAWTSFEPPKRANPSRATTGFIFYPGGRVDARSYAPVLKAIAAQGFWVIMPNMPLALAVLSPSAADDIIPAFPRITRWAIGGHSLGGAMAAYYVYNHPNKLQALILWAAYPASNNSLANAAIAVTSVSGSLDGLATPSKIEETKSLLPASTRFVVLEGGNHAQFGSYGSQPGDNAATMSRDEQQRRIAAATAEALNALR